MTRSTRIVVLDGYTLNPGDNPWDPLARLGELTAHDRTPAEQILERSRDAAILLTNKTPLTVDTIVRLPELRYVSVLATGYNVVDVQAARSRGIPVSNVPEYGTDSVAQHVFALLLELCHRVALHSAAVAAGEWVGSPDFCFWRQAPIELAGRTMGIVGFGRIGRRVGELAHAFGMNVFAADNQAQSAPAYRPFAWKEIPELFSQADVISLHCPLTSENAGFVNGDLVRRARPAAFFINTARGGLVDEAALVEALRSGQLGGAAVDVISAEPMRADHPLLGAPNCIVTPHMAWASLAARQRLLACTVRNVEAFLAGRPINVVN
jgi:glycerate dehydrogenase